MHVTEAEGTVWVKALEQEGVWHILGPREQGNGGGERAGEGKGG